MTPAAWAALGGAGMLAWIGLTAWLVWRERRKRVVPPVPLLPSLAIDSGARTAPSSRSLERMRAAGARVARHPLAVVTTAVSTAIVGSAGYLLALIPYLQAATDSTSFLVPLAARFGIFGTAVIVGLVVLSAMKSHRARIEADVRASARADAEDRRHNEMLDLRRAESKREDERYHELAGVLQMALGDIKGSFKQQLDSAVGGLHARLDEWQERQSPKISLVPKAGSGGNA